MCPVEFKVPKHVEEGSLRPAPESDFNLASYDTECLERALREYRELSWDDSPFEDLPSEDQHTILRRAQEMKTRENRLRTILNVRHRVAS